MSARRVDIGSCAVCWREHSSLSNQPDAIASRLVDQPRVERIALTGEGGLLPALLGPVLRTGLSVEAEPISGDEEGSGRAVADAGADGPGGAV